MKINVLVNVPCTLLSFPFSFSLFLFGVLMLERKPGRPLVKKKCSCFKRGVLVDCFSAGEFQFLNSHTGATFKSIQKMFFRLQNVNIIFLDFVKTPFILHLVNLPCIYHNGEGGGRIELYQ